MKLASAALRKPLSASDVATSSSKVIASPERSQSISSRAALALPPSLLMSRSPTAMAPALMKGLRGTPCSLSSCNSELKGLPEGSRWMRSQSLSPSCCIANVRAKSLETLWIENGTALSPAAASSPSRVRRAMPNWRIGTRASAGM